MIDSKFCIEESPKALPERFQNVEARKEEINHQKSYNCSSTVSSENHGITVGCCVTVVVGILVTVRPAAVKAVAICVLNSVSTPP
jgi:hypothetical protein